MKNTNGETPAPTYPPPLAVPDAEAARRFVGRWLRTTVGSALYPGEPGFVEESFSWDVPVWFSTTTEPMAVLVADVYINAATGVFLGRPTRDELIERVRQITAQEK